MWVNIEVEVCVCLQGGREDRKEKAEGVDECGECGEGGGR